MAIARIDVRSPNLSLDKIWTKDDIYNSIRCPRRMKCAVPKAITGTRCLLEQKSICHTHMISSRYMKTYKGAKKRRRILFEAVMKL